jgi:hypothetical protein
MNGLGFAGARGLRLIRPQAASYQLGDTLERLLPALQEALLLRKSLSLT